MSLGRTIKRLRQQKGWTLGQLQTYSGVAKSYLSRIERDQHKNVSGKVIAQIARALRVSTDHLFREAGWLPPAEAVGELSPEVAEIQRILDQLPPAERTLSQGILASMADLFRQLLAYTEALKRDEERILRAAAEASEEPGEEPTQD